MKNVAFPLNRATKHLFVTVVEPWIEREFAARHFAGSFAACAAY